VSLDVGKYSHYVEIRQLARTKSAGGGWLESATAIATNPNWFCSIQSATERAMERIGGGGSAVISTATRIIEGPYHSGITTAMQLFEDDSDRVFSVTAVENVDSEGEITRLICEEVLNAPAPVDAGWVQAGWIQ